MFPKVFRRVNKFLLVITSMACLCYWVAIRPHSGTITGKNVVLWLAGRQVDSSVGEESKVKPKEPLIPMVVKAIKVTDSEHEFKDYKMKGLATLHNLCIENDPTEERITIAANVTVTKKILVVYSSRNNSLETLNVSHTYNRPDDGSYQIHYHKGNRSQRFRYIEDYPAYFTTPSCTANLHHFWADSTEGLYKTLKFTNRLGSTVPNQVKKC